jgi:hypothetical protein
MLVINSSWVRGRNGPDGWAEGGVGGAVVMATAIKSV